MGHVAAIRRYGLPAISLAGTYRMFAKDWQEEPDNQGLVQLLLLLAALTLVVVLSDVATSPAH